MTSKRNMKDSVLDFYALYKEFALLCVTTLFMLCCVCYVM